MVTPADLSTSFALDVNSVERLKLEARTPSREALKKTAQQFEALFMNMMLKSMREAGPQDGLFDSSETRTYTAMLDQQLSQKLASRGFGLADVLVRQLSVTLPPAGTDAGADGVAAAMPAPGSAAPTAAPADAPALPADAPRHVQDFARRLWPHAQEAAAATGIPAGFLIGQAALESGWGRAEIRGADGAPSYNLFGIKAGPGWQGRSVAVTTTEYVDGRAQRVVANFRAYDSYADAFRDYAALLRANPRYREVIAQGQDIAGFAQGLQRAGYATDPNYAAKLMGVVRASGLA